MEQHLTLKRFYHINFINAFFNRLCIKHQGYNEQR